MSARMLAEIYIYFTIVCAADKTILSFLGKMWDIFYFIKVKLLKKLKFTEKPLDTFKYVFYNRVGFYAKACGSDVVDPAYKYTMRTYIFVASTVLFMFFSAFTIYSYENIHDTVKCLITLPFGFQVSGKWKDILNF